MNYWNGSWNVLRVSWHSNSWECTVKCVSMKIKMKSKIKNSLLTQKQGSILFVDHQLLMGATKPRVF